MATSTELIRDYISSNITSYDRTILEQKGNHYIGEISNRYTDIIQLPNGEKVVVAYADISITGSDRPKPQIRVFMDRQHEAYEFARKRKFRYFLFTIFSKDLSMAKNIQHYDPRDFLVSLETNIDYEDSRRDLRSLYDYLDAYISKNGEIEYLRCTHGQHQSGIYQASFIQIRKQGIPTPNKLMEYMTYFDNRPYLQSVSEELEQLDLFHLFHNKKPSYNRIIFGAPGTGKSFTLNRDSHVFGKRMERITFHPNYSYAQFVGTYKPVMEKNEQEEKNISYEYVPGPFMRIYIEAQKNFLQYQEFTENKNVNYYYQPATNMDSWNFFDEITELGHIEYFRATKEMKKGDISLVYIGNNNLGYESGIYGIARIISNPKYMEEDNGLYTLHVLLRFDKVSYDKPLISKKIFDPYNTQYQSVHKIEQGKELLEEIGFSVEKKDYLLLIEEINRANTAAVFGDVFQLLDRKNGFSEYPINTSEDVKRFLEEHLKIYGYDSSQMKLPDNMYIWATMNSADQGVFPMDTAFKRRWEFEYLGIDDGAEDAEYEIPLKQKEGYYLVSWNQLRREINTLLIEQCKVNEDKLLGPFFISKQILKTAANPENWEDFIQHFENKVIMYLFEDVVKMNPSRIFVGHAANNGKMTFSAIRESFEQMGEKIFGFELDTKK